MNLRKLAVLVFVSLLSAPLIADTIYTYTGNPFAGAGTEATAPYLSTDFVSITFTVTNPLPANLLIDNTKFSNVTPTSYSFSDGVQTLDNENSLIQGFNIGTDGSGHVINWNLAVFLPSGHDEISSEDLPDAIGDLGEVPDTVLFPLVDRGLNENNPGTWTSSVSSAPSTSPVPEPSTFALLGTGILGLAGIARRRLFGA